MLTLAVPAADGNGAGQTFRGGWASIYFTGTFDSGTLTLQVSDDATNYVGVLDEMGNAIALTADGYRNLHLAGRVKVRIVVSGSSSSTDVVCHVRYGAAAVRTGETL